MADGKRDSVFDSIEVVGEAVETDIDSHGVCDVSDNYYARKDSANTWRIPENAAR